MYRSRLRPLVTAFALIVPQMMAAQQGTGAQGFFYLHNLTPQNVVVGFYTDAGNGWSKNWLVGGLGPKDKTYAAFINQDGACEQIFRVGWLSEDGGEVLDDPFAINICEASNVYLGDNDIRFD